MWRPRLWSKRDRRKTTTTSVSTAVFSLDDVINHVAESSVKSNRDFVYIDIKMYVFRHTPLSLFSWTLVKSPRGKQNEMCDFSFRAESLEQIVEQFPGLYSLWCLLLWEFDSHYVSILFQHPPFPAVSIQCGFLASLSEWNGWWAAAVLFLRLQPESVWMCFSWKEEKVQHQRPDQRARRSHPQIHRPVSKRHMTSFINTWLQNFFSGLCPDWSLIRSKPADTNVKNIRR